MNVANLYDRLNERERVSALMRGDERETQRLSMATIDEFRSRVVRLT